MEEQGLVVVKDNFLIKIKRSLKRFFYKGKLKKVVDNNSDDEIKIKYINEDTVFVQDIILNARRAYRKYVINNTGKISEDIFSYVSDKIYENEDEIKKIIEINKDSISFLDIIKIIDEEKKSINQFKLRNKDLSYYQVPVGVVGVLCQNTKQAISGMLKAISTRNAVIILQDKYNKYSTEALICLIIQECLKNFYIDDNLVQIVDKIEIDLSKIDRIINTSNDVEREKHTNKIYVYQEDETFANSVIREVKRLELLDKYSDFDIEVIKGNFRNVIDYLNDRKAFTVCMYTNNSQKAYKLMNWVGAENVFINTGVLDGIGEIKCDNAYLNFKFVLHKDVF